MLCLPSGKPRLGAREARKNVGCDLRAETFLHLVYQHTRHEQIHNETFIRAGLRHALGQVLHSLFGEARHLPREANGDINRLPNMVKDHRPSRLKDRLHFREECIAELCTTIPLNLEISKPTVCLVQNGCVALDVAICSCDLIQRRNSRAGGGKHELGRCEKQLAVLHAIVDSLPKLAMLCVERLAVRRSSDVFGVQQAFQVSEVHKGSKNVGAVVLQCYHSKTHDVFDDCVVHGFEIRLQGDPELYLHVDCALRGAFARWVALLLARREILQLLSRL